AALTFTAMAAVQLAWGVLALLRTNRFVVWSGLAIGAGSVAGWAVAKSTGIPFIAGLDVPEPIQVVDALAAALALVTVLLLGFTLRAGRSATDSTMPRTPTAVAIGLVSLLSVYGMAAAGAHVHNHGAGGDDHGNLAAGAVDDHSGSMPGMPGMDHGGPAVV